MWAHCPQGQVLIPGFWGRQPIGGCHTPVYGGQSFPPNLQHGYLRNSNCHCCLFYHCHLASQFRASVSIKLASISSPGHCCYHPSTLPSVSCDLEVPLPPLPHNPQCLKMFSLLSVCMQFPSF